MRETWVQTPMEYLTAFDLSPNGDRVALTARGQVFVAPVKQGRLVEVTRKAGVRYREARFLPDGKSLLALSDESGEVEFWTLPANGVGRPSSSPPTARCCAGRRCRRPTASGSPTTTRTASSGC